MRLGMNSEHLASASSPDRSQRPSLARRWANWASNLLVSGVILIVGLAFGREVVHWWRLDDDSTTPATASGPDIANSPDSLSSQLLEFGDFPIALHRSELSGAAEDVLGQLRQHAADALSEHVELGQSLSGAELRMLEGTRDLDPVEQSPGAWSMYQIEAPLPMVVGVREPGQSVADAQRRVVSWGLAFPVATEGDNNDSSWTLFTCSNISATGGAHSDAAIPAPRFGRRTLSVRSDGGGAVVGFRGTGSPNDWTGYYDKWFTNNGWKAADDWHVEAGTWRRRFASESGQTANLLLMRDGSAAMRVLVETTPATDQRTR